MQSHLYDMSLMYSNFKYGQYMLCFTIISSLKFFPIHLFLMQIIKDLGGSVSSTGSSSTHIITKNTRRTLNFCIALCSGFVEGPFSCVLAICFCYIP